jgi:hypothetical protein
MAELFYAVVATLPDEATAREYEAWLAGGHLQAVIDAGATESMSVRVDPDDEGDAGPIVVATQYVFPSREAFEAYERDHAPALREDGRRRFGDRGVRFERRTGEVVARAT